MRKTKIVNLLGCSGCGKSTLAMSLTAHLKKEGFDVELALESCKELAWADRVPELKCQPFVFGDTLRLLEILQGKNIDYVVTDSPIILSAVYCGDRYPDSFKRAVLDIFETFYNVNFFLHLSPAYNPVGRVHSREEAERVEEEILKLLVSNNIPFLTVKKEDPDILPKLAKIIADA